VYFDNQIVKKEFEMNSVQYVATRDRFIDMASQARYEGKKCVAVVGKITACDISPLAVYSSVVTCRHGAPTALLESVQQGSHVGKVSVVGVSTFGELRMRDGEVSWYSHRHNDQYLHQCGIDSVSYLRQLLDELSVLPIEGVSGIPIAIGYVAPDAKRLVEPSLPAAPIDPFGLPDIWLYFYDQLIIFHHATQTVYLVAVMKISDDKTEDDRSYDDACTIIDQLTQHFDQQLAPLNELTGFDGPINTNRSVADYHSMVARAKELIVDGDLMQVVLSQRFSARFTGSDFDFYRHLRRRNPSPYMFHIVLGDDVRIVGASPEVATEILQDKLRVRPIAGTRPRGCDDVDDARLAEELTQDVKELAEHMMLVDLARDMLSDCAEPGTVQVVHDRIVEYYSTVMHLVSDVVAKLRIGMHPIDAFFKLFLAGTLVGNEFLRAFQRFTEIEGERRGPYGGAVGFFSATHIDTGIFIRSAVFMGERVYWQAGGGIVADSTPEGERAESFAKAASIGRVFDPAFGPATVVVETRKESDR
jgi:anthranilate synthase component 1